FFKIIYFMVYQDEINDICKLLKNDKVIICPTDTIWGLSCNVMSEEATRKIYSIKKRAIGKPFILLVSDLDMLKRYVTELHPRIETLLSHHNKPLTIIHSNPRSIPKYALATDGSIGIRIVKEEYCQQIIMTLNAPLVSTSANYSDHPSPRNFTEIDQKLISEVDYTAQYLRDQNDLNDASIIIKYDNEGQIEILRP
ncbi:MAG TPA: threonylcarbamoyl-AMP synthase, partial [Saprospirales bacterium]|nr:threonylcarbamoyl-AMP synthase [Saprospirales bacterium]